jgi:hypothetical protein
MNKLLVTSATLVGLSFIASIQLYSAALEKIVCFSGICVNPHTIQSKVSTFSGAPKYRPIKTFMGTRKFGDNSFSSLMEVDCQARQFRTTQIQKNGRWNNYDLRWTLVPSGKQDYLFKVFDLVCHSLAPK